MQVIRIQTETAKLGLDLGGVMQLIAEQTLSLIAADGAVVELAEEGEMVYRAASGIAAAQLGLRLSMDTSLSGLCVRTGETLLCVDSETDPRVDRAACRRVGLRSMIVLPLKHQGQTVGVLKALSKRPDKFKQRDQTLLEMLSELVAAAMFFADKFDSDDLFFRATHDCMTGLANRALFMDRLRNAMALADRSGRPAGILMIDMDGLKRINDTLGHRLGDVMLGELARRLDAETRDTDTAARLGGDEFGMVLSPLENAEALDTVVQRLDAAIAAPFAFEGAHYQLQASIGAALIPRDGVELEGLLETADQRMYRVKAARKAGVVH